MFLPNHPVAVSVVRCQVSLRAIFGIIKVPPFSSVLGHGGRSYQHEVPEKIEKFSLRPQPGWRALLPPRIPLATNPRILPESGISRSADYRRVPVSNEFLGITPTQNRMASPSTYRFFSRRRTGCTPAAPSAVDCPIEDRGTDEPVATVKQNPASRKMNNLALSIAVSR